MPAGRKRNLHLSAAVVEGTATRIIHIIPGSGDTFYCENCLRDAGLVRALRKLGHDAVVVPLYLPLMTDDGEAPGGEEVFFGGINVYLQQKFGLFRRTPRWIDRLFDSPGLLKWAARKAGATDPNVLAETALSMLRGEDGRQVKELDRLVEWLAAGGTPDVVSLSNVLLVGMARKIKRALGSPVVCALQDEDTFLDAFPEPLRRQAWEEAARRAGEVDAFLAASGYYADLIRRRLSLPAERVHVVRPGISMAGHEPPSSPPEVPVVGYLSRLCRQKGLDTLAAAFELLKAGGRLANLKLRVAGGWTADDVPFINKVRRRLKEAGLGGDVEFLPNLDAPGRRAFLRTLSVLSVPTRTGEAFGMFILESLASGVPVVLPRHGAFVELLEATGGGLLVPPNDPEALAAGLDQLLADPAGARAMARAGREAVANVFNLERMARDALGVYERVAGGGGT